MREQAGFLEKGKPERDGNRAAVFAFAFMACCLAFLLQLHVGFTLWDEGYLWYGVQRTLLGEVPLRDFMSYDPGRYYWAAALLRFFRADGVVAVRAATAVFAAIGIASATTFVWSSANVCKQVRPWLSAMVVLLCLLWMVPWWKQYDEAVSIALVISLAYTLARPSPYRFLLHGLVVGLAATIGRNHGFYGAIACLLALLLVMPTMARRHWITCAGAWVGGVVLGFCPILIALGMDHHFARMFWESIHFILFEYKGTNLPLPVPWPWSPIAPATPVALARHLAIGCMYVILPLSCLLGVLGIARVTWRGRQVQHAAFGACVLTAVPYLNVAFSRADLPHLAQSIFPLLLGVFVFPWAGHVQRLIGNGIVSLVVLLSMWVVLPMHSCYVKWTQGDWQRIAVGGDMLWMSSDVASTVEDIKQLCAHYVPRGGTILSVPVWPGAYALVNLKSPVYEIYPLFPRSLQFQEQELARLQQAKPPLVLFNDIAVDGRNDLRYGETHPLIMDYINRHYHLLSRNTAESQLKVYVPDDPVLP